MAINKGDQPNIDKSNLPAYPNGQIKDNDGTDNGTPVARVVFSDMFEFFDKLMRLAALGYSGTFDNEQNGYQLINALMNFAGKNDYAQQLGSDGNMLTLSVKIETMGIGEFVLAKASVDKGNETTIKGTTPVINKKVSISSAYKANDYVLIFNADTVMTIIRLATADNLDVLISGLYYLKAASQNQENVGEADDVATTPLKNKTVFSRRVNGTDSASYLAAVDRNGLFSKEDKIKLDALTNVRNRGWFSGVSPGGGVVGSFAPHSGDVASAQLTNVQYAENNSSNTYRVTMANPMDNNNYFIRATIQSEGTIGLDNDIAGFVFQPVSTTQFDWSLTEKLDGPKSLKIHIEAVQL